jgi:WD40 repeat protein
MKTLRGHRGDIQSVCFCPSRDLLFSSGYDKTIKIWNASSGKLLRTLTGHTSITKSLSFYDEHSLCYLLSGSWDSTIRVWDIRSGQCLKVFTGHENRVKVVISFALSDVADAERYILSGSDDCTIKLWSLVISDDKKENEEEDCFYSFVGHGQPVYCLALSNPANGQKRYLASGSADHTIRIWDLSSLTEPSLRTKKTLKGELNGHQGPVNSILFSQLDETKQLFSCSDDTTLIIWDYESGYMIRQLCGHRGGVTSLVSLFRDDSEYLLTVSHDTTLRIWNSKMTNELKRIDCSPAQCSLLSLTLSEDISGTKLAIGGTDGWLRLILRLEDLYLGLSMSGIGLKVQTQSLESSSSSSTSSPISRVKFVPKTRVLKNLVVGGFDVTNSSTYVQSPDSSQLLPKITAQKRFGAGKTLKESHQMTRKGKATAASNDDHLTTLSTDEPPPPHSACSPISHTSSPGSVRVNQKRIQPMPSSSLSVKSANEVNSSSLRDSGGPLKTKLLVDSLVGTGKERRFSGYGMSDDEQEMGPLDHSPKLPHKTVPSSSSSSPALLASPFPVHPTPSIEHQPPIESIGHDGRAYLRPVDCISPSIPYRVSRPLQQVNRRTVGPNKVSWCPPPKKEFILTVSLFAEPINQSKEAKVMSVVSYATPGS